MCMILYEDESCSLEAYINQVNGLLGLLHVNRKSFFNIKNHISQGASGI